MKLKRFLVLLLMSIIVVSSSNCAFLFDGAKTRKELTDVEKYTMGDDYKVMWGYVAMDIAYGGLIPGLIGLFIDYSTGAVYEQKGGSNLAE